MWCNQAVILNVREGRLQKNSILEKLDVLQTVVSKLNLEEKTASSPQKKRADALSESTDSTASPLKRPQQRTEPWLGESPVACTSITVALAGAAVPGWHLCPC